VCAFGTESCTLFAVDANTGKMLWSWWLGDPMTSAPAIAKGRVFSSYPATSTSDGKPVPPGATHVIAAFNLKTGKILWQKWLDSDVMSSPVVTGGFVFAATFGGTLVKLHADSGKVKYAIKARATSAPVVFKPGQGKQESMFFTRRADQPAAPASKGGPAASASPASTEAPQAEESIVHTVDNEPKMKYQGSKKRAEYLDEKVQGGSSYSAEGKANDAANGFSAGAPQAANPKAATKNIGQASVHTMQAFQGSRVLPVGKHNVNTMGDEVIGTSAATGKKLWSFKLKGDLAKEGGALGTSPLLAGGSVFVGTLAGDVLRINPKSGKVTSKYQVGSRVRAQPVAVGGWVYVGTEDGRLVAINTRDAKVDGWPMWGANAARTGVAKR
jgi:outer membrane protein assembly factor BamB